MCPSRIYQSFCCIMKTVAAAEFSVRVGLGGQVGVRLAPSARAPPVPGPLPSLLIQLHGTTFNFTFFSDNFNTRYEYTHCILCIHFDFLSKTKKFYHFSSLSLNFSPILSLSLSLKFEQKVEKFPPLTPPRY